MLSLGPRYNIACWFIDTAQNEESLFVRHAYFTGAEEPYKRLKRAVRADCRRVRLVRSLQTTSLPFDLPSTNTIAIKVINHYSDEVLKVIAVAELGKGAVTR